MVVFCIPCLVLLVIVGFMGIFFPKYKPLIKEAHSCFWDKLRMRPCQMQFDKKIKARMISKLIKNNKPRLAHLVKKYFETALIIIGVLMVILIIYLTYLTIDWILLGNKPCTENGVCGI